VSRPSRLLAVGRTVVPTRRSWALTTAPWCSHSRLRDASTRHGTRSPAGCIRSTRRNPAHERRPLPCSAHIRAQTHAHTTVPLKPFDCVDIVITSVVRCALTQLSFPSFFSFFSLVTLACFLSQCVALCDHVFYHALMFDICFVRLYRSVYCDTIQYNSKKQTDKQTNKQNALRNTETQSRCRHNKKEYV
jgi:hypothetical protein